ncbi:hypothetical protein [Cryptosporangium arvum]|uniref:Uncharacterized protein n=1 Tax=Cryptosporangium arvum DSM 44712 TaxID=927661 RepID=A0A010ZTP8_9ACTN|nr:hypothetical protein [Cryptosporangium arvum]EXG80592.1 hypothetical protein CryarDRAFT_1672 [Cryptosporangium arvum DSM 44712]
MAIAEELIAGIISSVLAVLLVEIYLWLRRRYRQRALRWLVGTDTVSVITPVYPWAENAHPAGLLTTYDAIGLAHVLEACNRVGTVPVVTRSGESAENSPLDVVAIGGPSGNQVTSTFLKAYCPGFEIITDPVTGQLSYRCGDRVFTRSDDETFAFIVRLSPRETGLPGTALIAWGHSAVATASAGYYLAKYPSALRKVGKGSFFVAISVRGVLGYRSFDTRPTDLTRTAFAPPVGGSRPVDGAGTGAGSSPAPAVGSAPAVGAASAAGSVSDSVLDSDAEREPEPRRRFGRSSRSTPAPRSPATGRSRVADALDDVRAETSAVTTADPTPTGTIAVPPLAAPAAPEPPPGESSSPPPSGPAKRPPRRTSGTDDPDPDRTRKPK